MKTRVVLLLFVLILPFNIIGIFSSLRTYSAALGRTRTAISYTLASGAELLRSRIDNTHAFFYEIGFHNKDISSMCVLEDENQYQITRRRFFTDIDSRIATANAADRFFVYVGHAKDYIQIPNQHADVEIRRYLRYMDEYSPRYSEWSLTEDLQKYFVKGITVGAVKE